MTCFMRGEVRTSVGHLCIDESSTTRRRSGRWMQLQLTKDCNVGVGSGMKERKTRQRQDSYFHFVASCPLFEYQNHLSVTTPIGLYQRSYDSLRAWLASLSARDVRKCASVVQRDFESKCPDRNESYRTSTEASRDASEEDQNGTHVDTLSMSWSARSKRLDLIGRLEPELRPPQSEIVLSETSCLEV